MRPPLVCSEARSTKAPTRWITRIIPIILAGIIGFAAYVLTRPICVDYLLPRGETAAALAFLIIHWLFFTFMVVAYIRTFLKIIVDPGVVPLGQRAIDERQRRQEQGRHRHQNESDLEGQPYEYYGPDLSPDSPGLEDFYTKDVFVCESDGRPRWCSDCLAWKPDRAHHSSEIGRCVRKMDHYCPWVGGIVSETSFKFFIQFTTYATGYCTICLIAAAYTVHQQIVEGAALDARKIVLLALAGFFGLFTCTMAMTASRFVFLNATNVEILGFRRKVYQLAIRVPRGTPSSAQYAVVTYPLPKNESGDSGMPTSQSSQGSRGEHLSARDALATRTFAIVKTEPGENPWHISLYQNWVSVMGTNFVDWILPIRNSPCVSRESHESFYEMGPLYGLLRERYGLGEMAQINDGTHEMTTIRGNRNGIAS